MSTSGKGPSLKVEVPLPDGVKVKLDGDRITAEGKAGKVSRPFPRDVLGLQGGSGKATVSLLLPERKRSRALLLTWERHVANLATGAAVGFEAHLKAVSAHFPMKISTKDDWVVIENFLGEKHPRRSRLLGGTKAEVKGEELVLTGADLEAVGQSAANLERATHIRDYDPRVFQDGIYITVKPRARESN